MYQKYWQVARCCVGWGDEAAYTDSPGPSGRPSGSLFHGRLPVAGGRPGLGVAVHPRCRLRLFSVLWLPIREGCIILADPEVGREGKWRRYTPLLKAVAWTLHRPWLLAFHCGKVVAWPLQAPGHQESEWLPGTTSCQRLRHWEHELWQEDKQGKEQTRGQHTQPRPSKIHLNMLQMVLNTDIIFHWWISLVAKMRRDLASILLFPVSTEINTEKTCSQKL